MLINIYTEKSKSQSKKVKSSKINIEVIDLWILELLNFKIIIINLLLLLNTFNWKLLKLSIASYKIKLYRIICFKRVIHRYCSL